MSVELPRRLVFARAPGVLWRRVADEILVLPPDTADPALLSPAAAVVWEALEIAVPLRELVGSLALSLDREAGAMSTDVERMLGELERLGLVVVRDAEMADA